jgi:hypothetical protein
MAIVQHTFQKSQSRGSARTLLLTLAIHAKAVSKVRKSQDVVTRFAQGTVAQAYRRSFLMRGRKAGTSLAS